MRSSVLGVQIGGGGGEPGRSEGRSFRRISATASSFHILGMKRQAGCRGLGSRGDNARHAADLRFRRPPHRRRAPCSTSASTTTPRPAWTPPRSHQPEAAAPMHRLTPHRSTSARGHARWRQPTTATHTRTPLLPRNLTPEGGAAPSARSSELRRATAYASTATPRRTWTRHTVRCDAGHLPPPLRARNWAAAISADASGGGCLAGASRVCSREFSPSWPRERALGSPPGGLAARHADQGVDGISFTVHPLGNQGPSDP